MAHVNVAFSDKTKAVIIAVFAVPQSIDHWPHQETVDTDTSAAYAVFHAELSEINQKSLPAPPVPLDA